MSLPLLNPQTSPPSSPPIAIPSSTPPPLNPLLAPLSPSSTAPVPRSLSLPILSRKPSKVKPKLSLSSIVSPKAKITRARSKSVTSTDFCRDTKGRRHNIKDLRDRRNAGVLKGMKWLSAFLCRKKHSALFAIGDDAPSVFFEIWYTSANSRVRGEAKGIAIKLIEVYERSLLKGKQATKPINVFFECMFVLRCKNEMNLDTGPLLALADKIFKEQDFQDTNKLFGVQGTIESLRAVSVEDWLMLLMKIMVMDFNNLLFPRRFPVTWGMKLALSALKGVPLYPPPKDLNDEEGKSKFHHSFYLATHIIYAIGAYSSVKTEAKAIPWLYGYCRKSLKFWMKRAHLKDKLMKNGDSGDSIYVDVDGIAECADVLRGQGLTEATDRLLCEASVWMLGKQKKEGSWPIWTTAPKEDWEPYDYLHPSWVCTQALRDRDFDVGFTRPGNVLWKKFIAKVLAEAKLDERVGWRIDWKRGEVVMEDNDV